MKITIKDLKQQKFTLDAEPSQTIAELKDTISKEKGWDAALQKLIYSGKVLQDSQTVESYNISEKGFVVCMVSKPKAPPAAEKPPATPSTPATSSTPAAPSAPLAAAPSTTATDTAVPATPTPTQAATAATTDTPSERNINDPSSLLMGSQREAAITSMEAMGFPRPEIERAMNAAFNNADRAVDFLLHGIPDTVRQSHGMQNQPAATATTDTAATPATATTTATGTDAEGDAPINLFEAAAQAGQQQGGRGGSGGSRGAAGAIAGDRNAQLAAAAAAAGGAGGGGAGGAGAGGAGSNLDFLRNNPQFQQLRQLVQQQPAMLEPILQNVGAGNPQLAQMISANPEQFLQLLSEDADDDAPLPPGAQAVSVTEEERAAIERLCNLGFEHDRVVQVFFACDRNEELAANFLFDNPDDDDEAGN